MPEMKMDRVGLLWSSAWKLYTDRFAVVTEIIAPPIVLLGLGNIFKAIGGLYLSLTGSVFLAAGVLLTIVAGASIINSLHHSTGFDESYRVGGRLFWRLIWIAILVGFATLGGFVMLVIPGIWLAIGFIFSNYLLVLEGRHGFAALTESREYAKGYWWAIFGRIVLLIIAFIIAYVIIGIPFAVIGGGIGRSIASAIISLFIIPFSIAYYYTMYRNLAALKPHVRDGVSTGGKTFVLIAQIVGAAFILLVALGIVFTALFGNLPDQTPNSGPQLPTPPGLYQ